jgi:redox-regulated HSP33 family molecular chaperone
MNDRLDSLKRELSYLTPGTVEHDNKLEEIKEFVKEYNKQSTQTPKRLRVAGKKRKTRRRRSRK